MIDRFPNLIAVFVTAAFLLVPASVFQLPAVPDGLPGAAVTLAPPSSDAAVQLEESFGKLPLYFVENQGQLDDQVAYYIQGHDKTIYFAADGVTFALTAPLSDTITADSPPVTLHPEREHEPLLARQRWAVKLDFLGADLDARPVGDERTEAVISYFKGPKEQWHAGLPTYSRIVYRDLWPGIDLVCYGTVGRLKYEFVVQPGADPARIRLAYRGATDVRLNDAGQLEVTTPLGGFADDVPVAYQEMDGQRVEVPVAYALDAGGTDDAPGHLYAFDVGPYDPTRPLVLDPALLVYCSYMGGSREDNGRGIAVDGAGAAYVTGWTSSSETTFPVAAGPDLTHNGGDRDAFVAKVNVAGTALVYCGYIGGSGEDTGAGIAVDGVGNAYVTGQTGSSEAEGFPVAVGPDLTFNRSADAFVAKVNAAGTALVYCGYIGGSEFDSGDSIAVDGVGRAYITGLTSSSEATFPVIVGPDLTFNGGASDVFVAKVSAAGTTLLYAGYIGGSEGEWGDRDNAVDGAGNAYVTGMTFSSEAEGFSVTVGPDLTFNGGTDAFVAKANAAGTALVYCGYIGGSSGDYGDGIAVDGAGNAYVTGSTSSTEATFPVAVGPDLTHNGGNDAFVAKVGGSITGSSINGNVTDGHNHSLPGVFVGLLKEGDPSHVMTTTTNVDGNYTFAEIAESGTYRVRVILRDGSSRTQIHYGEQGLLTSIETQPFTFPAGPAGVARDIDFGDTSLDSSIPAEHLDDLAVMFYHSQQVNSFTRNALGESGFQPVESVWGFSPTSGVFYSTAGGVNIDASSSQWDDPNCPMNREWHENFHHVMHDILTIPPYHSCQSGSCEAGDCVNGDCNHGGYPNHCTVDSWVEGWAEFWPCVLWDTLGYPGSHLYRAHDTWTSFEYNWRAWEYQGSLSREEFAVASLLWDLYDSVDPADRDYIDLTVDQIWSIIGEKTYSDLSDMKDVYDAFVAAGIGSDDSDDNGLSNLNDLFVAHGIFADTNDNHSYDPGEEIGRAADGSRPDRRNTPNVPNAYILVNVTDENGNPVPNSILIVSVECVPPNDIYNYSYEVVLTEAIGNMVALLLPPTDALSTANILAKRPCGSVSGEYAISK